MINCVGVDKNSKKLLVPIVIDQSQSVIDRYPVDKPPALLNPDGTPLHPIVDQTGNPSQTMITPVNIYAISSKDAEDIDLGLPPKDRSLTDEEKKKRIDDEIFLVKKFHTEIRSFIYDASPAELNNMRTNFTLAIAMFAELEDSIKANSEIDQQYFKAIIEYTIQSRMLVIDAMVARGISQ